MKKTNKCESCTKSCTKYYNSPRITSEYPDCAFPLTADPYNFCCYGCKYCFAVSFKTCNPAYKKFVVKSVNPTTFVNVMEGKRQNAYYDNFYTHRFPLHFGGLSDPFEVYLEKRFGAMRIIMKKIAELKYPTLFSTKGTFMTQDKEFLNFFEKCREAKNLGFQFSIITNDDKVAIENMAISCKTAGRGLGTIFVIDTINRQSDGIVIKVVFLETKYNNKLHSLYKFLEFELLSRVGKVYHYGFTKKANKTFPPWTKVVSTYDEIVYTKDVTEKQYEQLCEMAKKEKFIKDFPAMSFRWGWTGKIRIALKNDKIVGFHYFNICKYRNWANSYYIYVISEMRGVGIASSFFERFIKDAKELQKDFIKWLVPLKNTVAFNFYKNNNILPINKDHKHHIYKQQISKCMELF